MASYAELKMKLRRAFEAEQGNQVQFLNGTAAVSAGSPCPLAMSQSLDRDTIRSCNGLGRQDARRVGRKRAFHRRHKSEDLREPLNR